VSVRVEGNETVRIFPNPASDLINVESSQALKRIDIFNSAGKLVQSTQTGEKAIRMNIAGLPKGLYVVSVDGRELKIVK
jgi:protein subunit release factor A